MAKWYANKVILNVLIIAMIVGFVGYFFQESPQIKRFGLVIFLTAGTLVMIRGVIKITMGMRKSRK